MIKNNKRYKTGGVQQRKRTTSKQQIYTHETKIDKYYMHETQRDI